MALNDEERRRIITDAVEAALRNLNLDGECTIRRPHPAVVQVFVACPGGSRVYEVKTAWRWS